MKASKEISVRFIKAYYKLYGMQLVNSKMDFCYATGLRNQNFSPIEKGLRSATLDNIFLLCQSYNISTDWIILGVGDFLRKPDPDRTLINFEEKSISQKAMDMYHFNKDFKPEKLTDTNLERCVMYYSEKLRKNS